MRVVSQNSNETIVRNRALGTLSVALRQMTANLLDISRGFGRPSDLAEQADVFLVAMAHYVEFVGSLPIAMEISEALRIDEPIADLGPYYGDADGDLANRAVTLGALQMAAGRLRADAQQEAAGRQILMGAARQLVADDVDR